MKTYHVIFQTLRVGNYFTPDVAASIHNYVLTHLPLSHVGVITLAVAPDHIHMHLCGTHSKTRWRCTLRDLQIAISHHIRQQFPDHKFPRYLWHYNWFFSSVDSVQYAIALNNYITSQSQRTKRK